MFLYKWIGQLFFSAFQFVYLLQANTCLLMCSAQRPSRDWVVSLDFLIYTTGDLCVCTSRCVTVSTWGHLEWPDLSELGQGYPLVVYSDIGNTTRDSLVSLFYEMHYYFFLWCSFKPLLIQRSHCGGPRYHRRKGKWTTNYTTYSIWPHLKTNTICDIYCLDRFICIPCTLSGSVNNLFFWSS